MQKGKGNWSVLRYLIYFSQVGITVVVPPVLCCFAGILLGIAVAACSLRDFLRFTERKAREREKEEKLP